MNSTIALCARLTSLESVSTTMPSITCVVQVAIGFGNQNTWGSPVSSSRIQSPVARSLRGAPILARHIRHAPTGDMYSWLQK
ncbi:MAG: hypothetical protein U5J97_11990 [Trueperaceae bacterium]|nr:hypothetical protein [Trueperaceae bacterium]